MPQDLPDNALEIAAARLLNGALAPAEAAELHQWIEADPERRRGFGEMRAIAEEAGTLYDGWDMAALQRKIRQGREPQVVPIRAAAEMASFGGARKVSRAWPTTRLVPHSFRWAAGFGVVLGAVILIGVGLEIRKISLRQRSSMSTTSDERQYVAAPGRRVIVHLSDGSTVVLAPGSVLHAGSRFGVDARDVLLEGEAYFDVTHDTHMPFRVRTAQGFTEDIGTKFAVRLYAGDTASRVVVTEGKVAIGSGVILGAGDVAFVTTVSLPVVRHGMPVQHLISWTAGQLEFIDTPLRVAVTELTRWYGVEIRVDDPALARGLVTTVVHDAPVHTVLERIARMAGAHVIQRGTGYVLMPGMPGAAPHVP